MVAGQQHGIGEELLAHGTAQFVLHGFCGMFLCVVFDVVIFFVCMLCGYAS